MRHGVTGTHTGTRKKKSSQNVKKINENNQFLGGFGDVLSGASRGRILSLSLTYSLNFKFIFWLNFKFNDFFIHSFIE